MTIQKLTRLAAIASLPHHLAWHELVPGGEPRSLASYLKLAVSFSYASARLSS